MSTQAPHAELATVRHPGVARTLFIDVYMAFRLLRQVLRRIAGVPAGASFLLEVILIGAVAREAHRLAAPARRVLRRPRPSFADTAMAAAALREVPRSVAGVKPSEVGFTTAIIGASLVAVVLPRIAGPMRRVGGIFAAALAELGRLLGGD
jgi:hypothetical protein